MKNNTDEIFKKIPGFNDYKVSNLGRVMSFHRDPNGLIKKLNENKNGYLYLTTYNAKSTNKKKIIRKISRIIYEVFIGKIDPGMHIAHLNGNKKDNRLSNLKQCSKKENEWHKRARGTMPFGSRCKFSKLTDKEVINIRKIFNTHSKLSELKELSIRLNVSLRTIQNIILKRTWPHI
jgi:hypothetical protein